MALTAGTRLGSYEIVGPLGAGGMGEVYRAHDVKLGRDVAIKLLPEDFAHDAEYVARFLREAKVLAALNHVNVGAIYDLLNVANTHFLILELVEGETLAERVARGPLPVDEAIRIAIQIVEALEAAHQTGIVHRDLKPANIKITPQGRIKVLDFGLAKMSETRSLADPSAVTLTLAPAGSIVGTVSYMSPEQARGQDVTRQTDIWAFGCVFFEMLTGIQAFSGKAAADILAKILKEEPAWEALNTGIPSSIRRVIERCLHKDPRRRFHDAGDIRYELEEPPVEASASAPSRSNRPAIVLFVLLLISILAAGAIWQFKPENPAPSWSGTRLSMSALAIGPRVSPDGKLLAFQAFVDGNTQLAVMNPQSGNWKVLTNDNTAGSIDAINWSKDGTKIYFSRRAHVPTGVFSIAALGGEPRLVLEDAGGGEPLPDGSLLIVRVNASRPQLHRFWPDSGRLQELDAIGTADGYFQFRAFPDREEVVFGGTTAEGISANAASDLYILDLKTNKSRFAFEGIDTSKLNLAGVNPIDGSILLYVQNGDLLEIVSIPADGKGVRRVLLTLNQGSWGIDMASDGSLYVAQDERTLQALRFKESDQMPKAMAEVPASAGEYVLELPGDRFLLNTIFNGHQRLLVSKPNGELVPLVDTEEDNHGPATFAGPDRIAFILSKPPEQSIGIASVKDGRLMQRLKLTTNNLIKSMSASSDGKMLFYCDGKSILSIPSAGGEPRMLGAGDAVAFDPRHQSLVVQLDEKDGVSLVRMPLSGGSTEPIPMTSDLRIPAFSVLGPNSVSADGKIAFAVATRDSWFWGAAVLDSESGTLRRVPLRYDGDLTSLSWNAQNEIVAAGYLTRSAIWRYRPTSH